MRKSDARQERGSKVSGFSDEEKESKMVQAFVRVSSLCKSISTSRIQKSLEGQRRRRETEK